jgi:hypothetical protein
MALHIKKIFDSRCSECGIPGPVQKVEHEGKPVSAEREMTADEILSIYNRIEELDGNADPERETTLFICKSCQPG